MTYMGTIINTVAIILGGFIGLFCGSFLKERHQDTLMIASGISVLFIGISGALEGLLKIENQALISTNGMMVVISLSLGALIGELLDIETWFERFGEWLKKKSHSEKDQSFVQAFITASFTVCIGAMAIVGSIEDGLYHDYSILAVKAILDFVIIMVMVSSLGKGAIFSAIPVFIFQGSITVLASFIAPILSGASLANLSMVGNILIFCVGLNLVFGKKVKVANLLPSIIIAVLFAYI